MTSSSLYLPSVIVLLVLVPTFVVALSVYFMLRSWMRARSPNQALVGGISSFIFLVLISVNELHREKSARSDSVGDPLFPNSFVLLVSHLFFPLHLYPHLRRAWVVFFTLKCQPVFTFLSNRANALQSDKTPGDHVDDDELDDDADDYVEALKPSDSNGSAHSHSHAHAHSLVHVGPATQLDETANAHSHAILRISESSTDSHSNFLPVDELTHSSAPHSHAVSSVKHEIERTSENTPVSIVESTPQSDAPKDSTTIVPIQNDIKSTDASIPVQNKPTPQFSFTKSALHHVAPESPHFIAPSPIPKSNRKLIRSHSLINAHAVIQSSNPIFLSPQGALGHSPSRSPVPSSFLMGPRNIHMRTPVFAGIGIHTNGIRHFNEESPRALQKATSLQAPADAEAQSPLSPMFKSSSRSNILQNAESSPKVTYTSIFAPQPRLAINVNATSNRIASDESVRPTGTPSSIVHQPPMPSTTPNASQVRGQSKNDQFPVQTLKEIEASLLDPTAEHRAQSAWYLEHMHYSSSYFLNIIFALLLSFHGIIFIAYIFIVDSERWFDQYIFFSLILLLYSIPLCILIKQLEFVYLKYFIREELLLILFAQILSLWPYIISLFIDSFYNSLYLPTFFLMIYASANIICVIILPLICLFLSNRKQAAKLKNAGNRVGQDPTQSKELLPFAQIRLGDLSAVIRHPTGLMYFSQYLCANLCMENIVFWQAVERYRTILDDKHRARFGSLIYRGCFDSNRGDPEFQINVSSIEAEEVAYHARRREYTPDLFDQCQQTIFMIMKMDLAPRFFKSKYYEQLIDELESDEDRLKEHGLQTHVAEAHAALAMLGLHAQTPRNASKNRPDSAHHLIVSKSQSNLVGTYSPRPDIKHGLNRASGHLNANEVRSMFNNPNEFPNQPFYTSTGNEPTPMNNYLTAFQLANLHASQTTSPTHPPFKDAHMPPEKISDDSSSQYNTHHMVFKSTSKYPSNELNIHDSLPQIIDRPVDDLELPKIIDPMPGLSSGQQRNLQVTQNRLINLVDANIAPRPILLNPSSNALNASHVHQPIGQPPNPMLLSPTYNPSLKHDGSPEQLPMTSPVVNAETNAVIDSHIVNT